MSIQIDGTSGISGVDGSATTPALQGTDTNTGLTFGTDTVNVVTGGTTRATVDSNGDFSVNTDAIFVDASTDRVGIGNTNPSVPLEVGGSDADGTIFLQSGTNHYLQIYSTSPDGSYCEIDSQREFRLRTEAGNMRFATANTDRMTIDSSGRVGIGTTSPGSFNGDMDDLVVGSGSGSKGIAIYSGTSSTGNVLFHDTANTSISGMLRYDHSTNTMSFWTNGATERMKINNVGQMHSYSGNSVHYFYSGASATGSDYFIQAHYGATGYNGTESFRVTTNGNVSNTNNSYGSLSDIKLKENIVDANSQWDDLKALQVRNYNFKEGQTHTQIGVIAQEVELVSPGLVSESRDLDGDGNDLGTVTKYVNYSVLYMKSVKALQEAMERIETLETANASQAATIAAFEARLTALEGGTN